MRTKDDLEAEAELVADQEAEAEQEAEVDQEVVADQKIVGSLNSQRVVGNQELLLDGTNEALDLSNQKMEVRTYFVMYHLFLMVTLLKKAALLNMSWFMTNDAENIALRL